MSRRGGLFFFARWTASAAVSGRTFASLGTFAPVATITGAFAPVTAAAFAAFAWPAIAPSATSASAALALAASSTALALAVSTVLSGGSFRRGGFGCRFRFFLLAKEALEPADNFSNRRRFGFRFGFPGGFTSLRPRLLALASGTGGAPGPFLATVLAALSAAVPLPGPFPIPAARAAWSLFLFSAGLVPVVSSGGLWALLIRAALRLRFPASLASPTSTASAAASALRAAFPLRAAFVLRAALALGSGFVLRAGFVL